MRACAGGCSWVLPRLCSACEITPETVTGWSVKHAMHLDGPKGKTGWFGDIHTCVQEPRLQRMTRYYRATRSAKVSWLVDGAEVPGGLYCCCQYLNAPPVLDVAEFSALVRAPSAFADMRRSPDGTILWVLAQKGLVEFRAGKCRRTGARAVTPHGDLI